eukprot:SAG31_NODE_2281_length_6022_cov_3.327706_9_plen_668_part_00
MPKKSKAKGPPPPPFEHVAVPLRAPDEVPPLVLPCVAGNYYICSVAVKKPAPSEELCRFLCIEHVSGLKACCPEDTERWTPILRQPGSKWWTDGDRELVLPFDTAVMPEHMLPQVRLPEGVQIDQPASVHKRTASHGHSKATAQIDVEPGQQNTIAPCAADLKLRKTKPPALPEGWWWWQPREISTAADQKVAWRLCWRTRGADALEIHHIDTVSGATACMTLSNQGGMLFSPDITRSVRRPRVLQTMPSGEAFALAQYSADKLSLSPLLVLLKFMMWETLRLLFSELEIRERRRITAATAPKKGKKGKAKKAAAPDPDATAGPLDPLHPGLWQEDVLAGIVDELLATEAPLEVVEAAAEGTYHSNSCVNQSHLSNFSPLKSDPTAAAAAERVHQDLWAEAHLQNYLRRVDAPVACGTSWALVLLPDTAKANARSQLCIVHRESGATVALCADSDGYFEVRPGRPPMVAGRVAGEAGRIAGDGAARLHRPSPPAAVCVRPRGCTLDVERKCMPEFHRCLAAAVALWDGEKTEPQNEIWRMDTVLHPPPDQSPPKSPPLSATQQLRSPVLESEVAPRQLEPSVTHTFGHWFITAIDASNGIVLELGHAQLAQLRIGLSAVGSVAFVEDGGGVTGTKARILVEPPEFAKRSIKAWALTAPRSPRGGRAG